MYDIIIAQKFILLIYINTNLKYSHLSITKPAFSAKILIIITLCHTCIINVHSTVFNPVIIK